MSVKLKYNSGTICDPITILDATNLTAENVAEQMKSRAKELGVPMNVHTDEVTEGGLFGSRAYPCVVIEHPDTSLQYYTDVLVINGNTVNFYHFGISSANTMASITNNKSGLTGMLARAVLGSKEMEAQREAAWHNIVIEVFKSLIEA